MPVPWSEKKPISIYGNGDQTRDFTYVEDIVRGTIKAAEIEEAVGEIFNLGGGKSISINDVVQLLVEASQIDTAEIVYESLKSGDVSTTYADIAKAKKILSYSPEVGLKLGLSNFIKWYKSQILIN